VFSLANRRCRHFAGKTDPSVDNGCNDNSHCAALMSSANLSPEAPYNPRINAILEDAFAKDIVLGIFDDQGGTEILVTSGCYTGQSLFF